MSFSSPDCIRTYTGKDVNIFKPQKYMFCIEDIAWALSKEQRWGNMLSKNYSVAQHSMICAEFAPKEYKLTALCHDFSEAYMRDWASPLKKHKAFEEYRRIEDNLMLFLSDIFGFQYPLPDRVKEIDEFMAKREWNALMLKNEPFNYGLYNQVTGYRKFLRTFNELTIKNK